MRKKTKSASQIRRRKDDGVGRKSGEDLCSLAKGLHASAVPEDLPCREQEFQAIYDFVRSNIVARQSRSLYISGVPGTGKSATVHKVIRKLNEEKNKRLEFDLVMVNGMRLSEPTQIFPEILSQWFGGERRLSPNAALQALNRLLTTPDPHRKPLLLLVDEMDLLCTRRQHVLYQLFDWGSEAAAQVTILAIANTLDLPERHLQHRVSSRMGVSRECFHPYTFRQIEDILQSRLQSHAAVDPDAVQLISRKVAAVSGDLRRALEICRLAVDLAIGQQAPALGIQQVQEVLKELSGSTGVRAASGASFHERRLLQAAVVVRRNGATNEISLQRLLANYRDICDSDSVECLGSEELEAALARLVASRLFLLHPHSTHFSRRFALNIPQDDIVLALNSTH